MHVEYIRVSFEEAIIKRIKETSWKRIKEIKINYNWAGTRNILPGGKAVLKKGALGTRFIWKSVIEIGIMTLQPYTDS